MFFDNYFYANLINVTDDRSNLLIIEEIRTAVNAELVKIAQQLYKDVMNGKEDTLYTVSNTYFKVLEDDIEPLTDELEDCGYSYELVDDNGKPKIRIYEETLVS